MTQRQDFLDFPGAEALQDAGRVEPPAPRVLAHALAAVDAAARQETARHPVEVPRRRRSFAHGRRILATAVAAAAVAAGVVAYGSTGGGPGTGHPAPSARQPVTAAAFLDHTADVAYASSVSSGARYWKVREKVGHTGAKPNPAYDLYYARSMDAVYIVADGRQYKKSGLFGWRLGPKELNNWSDLDRLPTDPAKLAALMNGSKEYGGQSAFLQAGSLLGASPASPGLRAGLYRALSRLHGVKLVGTVKDSAGRTGTELVFDGVASSDRMVIDPKTSMLLETTSVSTKGSDRGTATHVTYLAVGPVDKIG
ncbi:CU044_5270 family protein [Streptomyces sp. NPDC048106]|uniref:CU044_5270 family protein n=1 Tax=Streptomyces sp. NPDC048106 TaxID=3155750 RepID=UPI003451EAE6